jgi:hypothetical protein
MASPAQDQTALMKEILESIKILQASQTQLASNVDAISGRVNILSGIKAVKDVAATEPPPTPLSKSTEHLSKLDNDSHDHAVPESPSLPATEVTASGVNPSEIIHSRSKSVTSRIILT